MVDEQPTRVEASFFENGSADLSRLVRAFGRICVASNVCFVRVGIGGFLCCCFFVPKASAGVRIA